MEFGTEVTELASDLGLSISIRDNILESTKKPLFSSTSNRRQPAKPHLTSHADEEVHHGVCVLLVNGLGKKGVCSRQRLAPSKHLEEAGRAFSTMYSQHRALICAASSQNAVFLGSDAVLGASLT